MRITELDWDHIQIKPEWWTRQDFVIVNLMGTISASSWGVFFLSQAQNFLK